MHSFTLEEIVKTVTDPLEIIGDGTCIVNKLSTLQSAQEGSLSFFANKNYLHALKETKASAVIIKQQFINDCPTNAIISDNPYLTYAHLSHLFTKHSVASVGIHATSIISESAKISSIASIGANVIIGNDVEVGDGVIIEAGVFIGDRSIIGANSHIHANVSLYHDVILGERVIIHSGAVIGADGFAFAPDNKGIRHKIAQIGGVNIGNDVEIGASSTIDRGSIDDTVLEEGVKLDNQVQIGHNVRIGAHSVLAGCVGVAGSTKIGKFCQFGGAVGVSGHLTIADNVIVSVRSLISQSIVKPGVYSSGTPLDSMSKWKKNMLRFRSLDDIYKRVRRLENDKNS